MKIGPGSTILGTWTFLTNHGHVLLCIAAAPDSRLREIALRVGITERSTQRIVHDLIAGGYLTQARIGRCNHYQVHPHRFLRHPLERESQVGSLLALIHTRRPAGRSPRPARRARP